MRVRELIAMLKEVDEEAEVVAVDVYGEGRFPITGMVYGGDVDEVELSGEERE